LHLKGLQALGAEIRVERGYVIASAKKLRGANIFLGGPFGSTVTGTCNVMAAAALAEGTTTIEAAACEPEVVDLGRFLNAMGAKITGLGTPFLKIEGVEKLKGTTHTVIPDRIEAATLMMAAALTGGDVELENVEPFHLTAVLETLREIGVEVQSTPNGTTRVRRVGLLKPADCVAQPYPGVPTDVQAQLMALLTKAEGISIVTDKVFPDRFMHASELVRLGARIRREGPSAIITGVSQLSGACVMASDLRASAALVIAALAAEGETVIRRIYHLDRGYERLEVKLNQLGARIQRLTDAPEHLPEALQPEGIAPLTSHASHAETKPPHWLHPAKAKVQ
jgi:UDP-N-acetylglucosamine 1-carboxyvinyltransferase